MKHSATSLSLNVMKTVKSKFCKPVILCALVLCSATAFAQDTGAIRDAGKKPIEGDLKKARYSLCIANGGGETACRMLTETLYPIEKNGGTRSLDPIDLDADGKAMEDALKEATYAMCIAKGSHRAACEYNKNGDTKIWDSIDHQKKSHYEICRASKVSYPESTKASCDENFLR